MWVRSGMGQVPTPVVPVFMPVHRIPLLQPPTVHSLLTRYFPFNHILVSTRILYTSFTAVFIIQLK